ncbi:MAG: 23S rRNA (adenine(2503)-C(2))-methyltransferase RlmN [Desulfobulbaceae bacterium]|nr:23S rRNA (adenine(2503)-C(2))-methyltransferase RlmN [Desulfobulbaceae bacterium]
MTMCAADKTDLRNLDRARLADFLAGINIDASRADQLFTLLHQPGVHDLADLSEMKRTLREQIQRRARISFLTPTTTEKSTDGTVKLAFRLNDGATIESVLIPTEHDRHTLCVSSQVGCGMGCTFCLTGTMGFKRNLSPAEIVNQVLATIEYMIAQGMERSTPREFINNLVFMGMGEPLANYDNLLTSLNILMDERGLEFTERRVTVSTCGIVPKITALGRDARVNLAISLHAADDETRNQLMPVNRTYPLEQLLNACRNFPLGKKKVILIEYILLKGINDSDQDALLLADKLTGIPCRINLLPYNQSAPLPYQCPSSGRIKTFQKILRDQGYMALIRDSRGGDISAACGQLAVNLQPTS